MNTWLTDYNMFIIKAALDHCQDKNPPVECEAAIKLSPEDPVFGKYNLSLLKFMRCTTSKNYSCPLVPATIVRINNKRIDFQTLNNKSC